MSVATIIDPNSGKIANQYLPAVVPPGPVEGPIIGVTNGALVAQSDMGGVYANSFPNLSVDPTGFYTQVAAGNGTGGQYLCFVNMEIVANATDPITEYEILWGIVPNQAVGATFLAKSTTPILANTSLKLICGPYVSNVQSFIQCKLVYGGVAPTISTTLNEVRIA